MTGWLGALVLMLAGYGWGARLSGYGSPLPLAAALLLTLGASGVGPARVTWPSCAVTTAR